MTFASSPVTDLLNGFAGLLDAANVGFKVRADGSKYQAGEIPIVKLTMRAITGPQVVLNWIALGAELEIPQNTGYLQVACIGSPDDADSSQNMAYAAFTVLHNTTDLQFGQAHVVQCLFENSVPMGQDEQLRNHIADHYTCDVEFPPTSNRPA